MKPVLFILLVWGSVIYSCKSDKYELRSPDGNILVQTSFTDSGLYYCVYLDDTLVVRESQLGVALKGVGYDFITGLHVTDVRREEISSFHGDYPPRGERRTYPNIATQEGVKGAEYYLFAPDNEIPTPEHNCTLPFTRNVVGPMEEYMPLIRNYPFSRSATRDQHGW